MYTAADRGDATLMRDPSPRPAELSVLAEDFFGRLAQDSSSDDTHSHYFTAPLRDLPGLIEHAPFWESMASSDSTHDDPRAMRPWLQLWAADAGACTQAHYDVADNVFVNLSGSKEFLLWPPQSSGELHLFPDAHPRARKAQVCVERPDYDAHPLAADLASPIRVLLGPGDALSIPAFWFHHVTSRSACVSLNCFSESPCKLAAAELLALPMPLHLSWPDAIKREGLLMGVSLLEDALGTPVEPLLAQIIDSRFTPLRAGARRSVDDALADGHASMGAPGATPSRRGRRRRGALPPSDVEQLRPALLDHAAECAHAVTRLRDAIHEAAAEDEQRWRGGGDTEEIAWLPADQIGCYDEAAGSPDLHFAAVRDLTLMHLLELNAVRLFGPVRLEEELLELRQMLGSPSRSVASASGAV